MSKAQQTERIHFGVQNPFICFTDQSQSVKLIYCLKYFALIFNNVFIYY